MEGKGIGRPRTRCWSRNYGLDHCHDASQDHLDLGQFLLGRFLLLDDGLQFLVGRLRAQLLDLAFILLNLQALPLANCALSFTICGACQ